MNNEQITNEQETKEEKTNNKFQLLLMDVITGSWVLSLLIPTIEFYTNFKRDPESLEIFGVIFLFPFLVFSIITFYNVIRRKSTGSDLFDINFVLFALFTAYLIYDMITSRYFPHAEDLLFILPVLARIVFFKRIKKEDKLLNK